VRPRASPVWAAMAVMVATPAMVATVVD
jgi:hypothetical protein